MIYRFRVILDTEEDVFRDLVIESTATFEELNDAIVQSFDFEGGEMASFYLSDQDWTQGEEITLFDMSEGEREVKLMNKHTLEDFIKNENDRMIYVYDFFNMWTFFVEVMDIHEPEPGVTYPVVLAIIGDVPAEAPNKTFEADDMPLNFNPNDEFSGEDMFKDVGGFEGGYDEYDDLFN